MKNYLTILFTFASIIVLSQNQATQLHEINIDTTWSSDTVRVYNDILVESQATLTINPGVYVEFQGNYSIDVYGKIYAIGELNDSIYFNINNTLGFDDDYSDNGGWGSIKFFENEIDTSIFSYCKFSYGKAVLRTNPDGVDSRGGCIYANGYAYLTIQNSLFFNNRSYYSGGAVHIESTKNINLNNNTFIKNKTLTRGGAVTIQNFDSLFVTYNLFYDNTAYYVSVNGYAHGTGGGLNLLHNYINYDSYAKVSYNWFYNNYSVNGALYESTYNCDIFNNIIANNFGVGLMNGHGLGISKYINNTIVNNLAFVNGTGIDFNNDEIKMKNNIIWGNDCVANIIPVQVYSGGDLLTADLSYSCIQDGYVGEGNIENYPQFANPTEGPGRDYDGMAADWTLLETSPCINKGTPDTTGLNLPQYDIAGNPRVFGGRIDMGAYENQNVYVKINDSPVYSKIKLYPNPGTDKIYIDIPPEMDGAWIDIVDGQGRVLMHEQISFSPAILSPYKLQSGIYFYRIYNENKVVRSGKWVKR